MVTPSNDQPSSRVTPVVIHESIAYVSGQLPRENGVLTVKGKVGRDVSLEQAQAAARLCAAACLDHLVEAVGPSGRVIRVIKITGFVASGNGFVQQGAVVDAASEVLIERLGESGAHARSAIGVAELPHGAPVEVEMVAAVSA